MTSERHWVSNEDRLAMAKVEELRMLKQSRARWREERAHENQQMLGRMSLLQRPLPTDQEDRLYKKRRELQVRRQINTDYHRNAFSQLQKSNETLESLKDELSEKIQAVENARIRHNLGVPSKENIATKSDWPADKHVAESIESIDQTFATIQKRIEEVAKQNSINLDAVIPKEQTFTEPEPLKKNEQKKVNTKDVDHFDVFQREEKIRSSPTERTSTVSDELKSMRQSYLQRGGRDPDVLARLADMENEAMYLAQGDTQNGRADLRSITDQLASIQRENAKIAAQLLELRARKTNTETSVDGKARSPPMLRKQKEYEQQWEELKEELHLLREQVGLQRAQRQVDQLTMNVHQNEAPYSNKPPSQKPSDIKKGVDISPNRLKPSATTPLDPLPAGPYDPKSGFVVFYDAVIGLGPGAQMCGLAASLYSERRQFGQPGSVPTVLCQEAPPQIDRNRKHRIAVLAAKQPVPRCWPAKDMSLVVELQVGDSTENATYSSENSPHVSELTAKAWCMLAVFDAQLSLRSGWWRLPLRLLPVRPELALSEQNAVPQYEQAELLLRLVNHRDMAMHSDVLLDTRSQLQMYQQPYAKISNNLTPADLLTPSTNLPTPPMPTTFKSRESVIGPPSFVHSSVNLHTPNLSAGHPVETDLCLQVLHVKHAPLGEARVQISVYSTVSGQVHQSAEGPVTCTTLPVRSGFRHQLHVFGLHESVFSNVSLIPSDIMIIKLYVRVVLRESGQEDDPRKANQLCDEKMLGWVAMPLLRQGYSTTGTPVRRIQEGQHELLMHHTALPELTRPDLLLASPPGVSTHSRAAGRGAAPGAGPVSVTIRVFPAHRHPGSPMPSILSSDEEKNTTNAWLPLNYERPPSEIFEPGDGIDIYIDGCRFLPDGVTISKVAGRILDRNYHKVGRDLSTIVKRDTNIYNPVYDYRVEVREQHVPATATLLLKLYTVEKWSRKLVIVGFAALKIFTLPGTTDQPKSNEVDEVALNAGAHQVRLWAEGPDGLEPFTESGLWAAEVRRVPCATVLIRIIKAPRGANGKPLEAIKVPQSNWERLGLWVSRPAYSQRHYISMSCEPWPGERRLYRDLQQRQPVTARNALFMVAEDTGLGTLKTEKEVEAVMKRYLTRSLETLSRLIDLSYISRYSPKYGVKVSLDGATNLPWSGFTHATICLNPPAALYQVPPHVKFDLPVFTSRLDLESHAKAPRWTDGYKSFTHRTFHPYLCVIIHLHEVLVSADDGGYKYVLMDQAWTAIPVVTDGYPADEMSGRTPGYAMTSAVQAPLFSGKPSAAVLSALSLQGIESLKSRTIGNKKNKIRPVESASVWVRVADGRRGEELPHMFDLKDQLNCVVDKRLLTDPEQYVPGARQGASLRHLVPGGGTTPGFSEELASNFKSLVYRHHNEGKFT